ncbi:hypothetical protein [Halorarum halobium]|uniref:hypothetical protein n=1 Tax=Halorarum halobium TaxID=3075121 RepID=UPI0028B24609|nr:hypothetical protein [Halobaculum sp. XH14]
MTRSAVQTALTLYGAGTLTATQAATRAGVSEERFETLCERFGLGTGGSDVAAAAPRPASAD